jgi:glucosamine--fructose-6-phosphate aminotransferase (isomerizing)
MTFFDEINQQSAALSNLLREYKSDNSNSLRLAALIKERSVSEFIFTGMGSSCFAGYAASSLLSKKGIKAKVCETKDLTCGGINSAGGETLIFLISQSGTCKEILDFCKTYLTDGGYNSSVITNNAASPLYQYGEIKFLIHAGDELMTASKTYTNTIASLLYICNIILESKGLEPYDFYGLAGSCSEIINNLVQENSNASPCSAMTEFFAGAKYICYVGGGASFATANQSGLITEEAGKMYAARYSPAQFLHGPVELIGEGFNTVAFDFSGSHREEIDRVTDNVLTYGGKICLITNRKTHTRHDNSGRFLCVTLPVENEFYAPLADIVPVELFINNAGLKRGLTPGVLTRVKK